LDFIHLFFCGLELTIIQLSGEEVEALCIVDSSEVEVVA